MGKENEEETLSELPSNGSSSPLKNDSSRASTSSQISDGDLGLPACRVCQCVESDKRGDVVLSFLGITPPTPESHSAKEHPEHEKYMEFVGPTGEIFVCNIDLEMGGPHDKDTLIELGCACKNDLALVHYACALKWFVNHESTICEICGSVASNIRSADFRRVLGSLKDYEALRDRTVSGVPNPPAEVRENSGVDPDAIAAIRRQRLSEIYLWFTPHGSRNHHQWNSNEGNASLVDGEVEQNSNIVVENGSSSENPAAKWAVEGTGILLATGLLTVSLAWLIAPRVGKKTAKNGLHILLGGVCALAVVVFFRFIVLTKIKYGPARYWAILSVFWFLVFAIWASRTHAAHPT